MSRALVELARALPLVLAVVVASMPVAADHEETYEYIHPLGVSYQGNTVAFGGIAVPDPEHAVQGLTISGEDASGGAPGMTLCRSTGETFCETVEGPTCESITTTLDPVANDLMVFVYTVYAQGATVCFGTTGTLTFTYS